MPKEKSPDRGLIDRNTWSGDLLGAFFENFAVNNAVDAGATKVHWSARDNQVYFQHDGTEELNQKHIRGLASLGASTKGLTSVGFMGVGFKSVYLRFLDVQVSGFGWNIQFSFTVNRGAIEQPIIQWFYTLRPQWAVEELTPINGYTTIFRFGRPRDKTVTLAEDLLHLINVDDPTPTCCFCYARLARAQDAPMLGNQKVNTP